MRAFGPYDAWLFDPALGAPFALPAYAREGRAFATGLAAGAPSAPARALPLWDGGAPLAQMPVAALARSDLPGAMPGLPLPEAAWVPDYAPAERPPAPRLRPRAIVAVIDSGLPLAHRAFLDGAGQTRIAYAWQQTAAAPARAAVPFGREWSGAEIDAARAAAPSEPAAYAALGALRPTRRASHGAHVMGIAAGNASAFGTAQPDDIAIIAVQLPDAISLESSGLGKEAALLFAMHYVFDRASQIAGPGAELPLVVNLSYGWPAGRHDGADPMARALSDLLARRQETAPTELILPAGNHFESGMHARFEAADLEAGAADFSWVLPPDDRTCSYLELWLPRAARPGDWRLALTAPHGAALSGGALENTADPALDWAHPGAVSDLIIGGEIIGRISAERHNGDRWRFIVALIPNAVPAGRRAPSGRWGVRLAGQSGLAPGEAIEIWAQRDDDPIQLNSGARQSRIARADGRRPVPLAPRLYEEALVPIRRYGALNVLATAAGAVCATGLVGQSRPAPYADTAVVDHQGHPAEPAPADLIAATTERSPLRPGTLSIGTLSGSRSLMRGSSMAAPAIARAMLANMANGLPAYDNFGAPPPLRPEDQTALAPALHPQRAGRCVAPLIPPRSEAQRDGSGSMTS